MWNLSCNLRAASHRAHLAQLKTISMQNLELDWMPLFTKPHKPIKWSTELTTVRKYGLRAESVCA
jgi:hypothetical protein